MRYVQDRNCQSRKKVLYEVRFHVVLLERFDDRKQTADRLKRLLQVASVPIRLCILVFAQFGQGDLLFGLVYVHFDDAQTFAMVLNLFALRAAQQTGANFADQLIDGARSPDFLVSRISIPKFVIVDRLAIRVAKRALQRAGRVGLLISIELVLVGRQVVVISASARWLRIAVHLRLDPFDGRRFRCG